MKSIVFLSPGKSTEWINYLYRNTIDRDDVLFWNGNEEAIQNKFLKKVYTYFNHGIFRKLGININRAIYKSLLMEGNTQLESLKYFVFFCWNQLTVDYSFHKYIREKYPNVKLVLVMTATYDISKIFFDRANTDISEACSHFDIVCSYDKNEAEKYGFTLIPLTYNGDLQGDGKKKYDVCYVGSSKNRLDDIHSTYTKICELGYKAKFFVNGVKEEDMLYDDIEYNKVLTYKQCLQLAADSRCSLEIVDGEQSFSTIRYCETILLNTKFITNNTKIVYDELYDNEYVLLLSELEKLDEFISKEVENENHPKKSILQERELINILEKSN